MNSNGPKKTSLQTVASRENLCAALNIGLEKFEEMLQRSDEERFKKSAVPKKNGVGFREVFCPAWDLRILLRKFNSRFFANPDVLVWQSFLYGCVPNGHHESDVRDYVACAAAHIGARSILKVDIRNFFSSISEEWVRKVFQLTLKFPRPVARDIAKLNCVDGALVQGSPCASYIAAAIFREDEAKLVRRLATKGYRYTRYVDDITISCRRREETFSLPVRLLDDLFSFHDLERNIEKTSVLRAGSQPLVVHGLRVGSTDVCLPRSEFKAIRASVKTIETYANSDEFRTTLHYRRMYARCMGRVGKLARTKDKRSARYFDRLRLIRPLSSQEDIDLCTRWIEAIERNAHGRANYFFHIKQANRTWARLSILAWTFPDQAAELRKRLVRHVASYETIKIS